MTDDSPILAIKILTVAVLLLSASLFVLLHHEHAKPNSEVIEKIGVQKEIRAGGSVLIKQTATWPGAFGSDPRVKVTFEYAQDNSESVEFIGESEGFSSFVDHSTKASAIFSYGKDLYLKKANGEWAKISWRKDRFPDMNIIKMQDALGGLETSLGAFQILAVQPNENRIVVRFRGHKNIDLEYNFNKETAHVSLENVHAVE